MDLTRMGSTEPVWITITFLPSWEGRGYTASIAICGKTECEADGWRKDGYQHVRGVALLPGRLDWAIETVVKRLKMQGVTFLYHQTDLQPQRY
ncbi:hypothetical protein [Pseudogemmobacter faecipullorum]|uniref:Uncharacterized protein n=1 Tax=Pseudogemmobacter faecipullorum TaxID=2755041 RepID=A0ABS8CS13_9RHOB|nr:hypothetical protein [Pseudogemmobacter faecipullorum]MCB5412191.1 hypothetical protein [Pseudogemmobacter faecipullorum]